MTTNTTPAQHDIPADIEQLLDEWAEAAGCVWHQATQELLPSVKREDVRQLVRAALASQQAARQGPLNDAMACADLCEEIARRKGERFFGQQISDGSAEQCARAIRYMFGITAQGGSADAPGSLYDLSDKGFVDINKGGSKS